MPIRRPESVPFDAWRRTAPCTAVILLAPVLLAAQGALPPAPPGDAPAITAEAPASGRPGRWTLRLGANQSWDSSPRAVSDGAAVHFMGRASAGLAHGRLGRRGQLVAAARVSSSFAEDEFAVDRVTYDVSLAGGTQLGSRLRLAVSDSLHTAYTDESPALAEDGAVLERGLMRENTARAELLYQWSPRTSFSSEVRHELMGFDSDALVDRSRAAVRTGYRRHIGRSQSFRLDHMYQIRFSDDRRGAGQRLSAAWSGSRQDRQSLSLSLGVERVEALSRPGHLTRPYGAVEAASRGRRGGVSLRYQRSFTLAYETFDNRATDALGLTFDRSLGRRAGATLSTRYSIRHDPAEAVAADHMARLLAGLSLQLTAGLDLVSSYSYQWRRRSAADTGRHRVDVGLSYGRTWW